ncbi:hypothetical protein CIRMBP1254_01257 [Enterococcus cecorum]|nr:hypothetical protein CIRMBP1254_01257 [Enterococcus cecorum]
MEKIKGMKEVLVESKHLGGGVIKTYAVSL